MMSVDEIIERIEKDYKRKIENIMEEQREKAERVKEKIEAEKEKRLDEIRKEREREIKTMENRILSQAQLEKQKKRLSIREEMMEKVFNNAMQELKEMDPDEYEDYLRKSIGKVTNVLKGEIVIFCNPESREKIESLVEKIDPSLEVKPELDSTGGIIGRSEEGSQIDLTFEANLKKKKKDLRKVISEILFGEEQ